MNSRKLAQPQPAVMASRITELAPRGRPSFDSISSLAPLLEEMTDKMGGSIVISSGGADIFCTRGHDPNMMTAGDGIIELEVGGRTAHLRFLRQTTAACPAFSRFVLLGQLSSGMAHDINNLLAAILGNISLMEQLERVPGEDPGDSRTEMLREMSMAAQGIAALCRRIQSLGSQKTEVHNIRVAEVVSDALIMVRPIISSARQEGTEIFIENRVPEGLWCMAIPAELQSCIINILRNAVEHGFRGKESGTIVLEGSSEEGMARLDISNDGHMIPPGVSENLLRKPLTSECNNGIGLFTATERLRSFGSWMTFSSEPGLTVFSVTLIQAQTRH